MRNPNHWPEQYLLLSSGPPNPSDPRRRTNILSWWVDSERKKRGGEGGGVGHGKKASRTNRLGEPVPGVPWTLITYFGTSLDRE